MVTDQCEPGSTFKMVTVAAALENGIVTPDTPSLSRTRSRCMRKVIHEADANVPSSRTLTVTADPVPILEHRRGDAGQGSGQRTSGRHDQEVRLHREARHRLPGRDPGPVAGKMERSDDLPGPHGPGRCSLASATGDGVCGRRQRRSAGAAAPGPGDRRSLEPPRGQPGRRRSTARDAHCDGGRGDGQEGAAPGLPRRGQDGNGAEAEREE